MLEKPIEAAKDFHWHAFISLIAYNKPPLFLVYSLYTLISKRHSSKRNQYTFVAGTKVTDDDKCGRLMKIINTKGARART